MRDIPGIDVMTQLKASVLKAHCRVKALLRWRLQLVLWASPKLALC